MGTLVTSSSEQLTLTHLDIFRCVRNINHLSKQQALSGFGFKAYVQLTGRDDSFRRLMEPRILEAPIAKSTGLTRSSPETTQDASQKADSFPQQASSSSTGYVQADPSRLNYKRPPQVKSVNLLSPVENHAGFWNTSFIIELSEWIP